MAQTSSTRGGSRAAGYVLCVCLAIPALLLFVATTPPLVAVALVVAVPAVVAVSFRHRGRNNAR